MSNNKVLIAVIILLSAIIPVLSGCAKDTQKPKEITITTNSDEALKLFLNGRDVFETGKFPQAAQLFDKAIAVDKNLALAYMYSAISGVGYNVSRENLSKAVGLIDKVSVGEKHLILYYEAIFDNEGAKQKQELDSLLNLYPDDKRVQDLAGIYYYSKQDYPNALNHLKKAVAIDSTFAQSYNMLGYVFLGMENFTAAEEPFKKYIELNPKEANPYDSYAEFLLIQGRYDESIEQYKKAIQTDPEFVLALIGIGNNYIFKKNYNKARDYYQQYYDKSFNINQKFAALWWKAVSYVYEGNINEAIEVLDERSELAIKNNAPIYVINGYSYAGVILTDNGNIIEAEKYFNKAADFNKSSDMDETNHKAYEIFSGLDRCHLKILKKNIDGAEKDLGNLKQEVEKRQVTNEINYLNLIYGILEYSKGNYDLALEYFNKSDKESPYTWYWEAITQEKAGNTQETKRLYKKIASSNINSMELALVRNKAIKKL